MASEYPFRKIVGVELIAELHRVAEENIRAYKSATQRCSQIEVVCADACEFAFPGGPLVLYLFNPLPVAGMRRMVANLEKSLAENPRIVWVLYHNPLLEHVIGESGVCESWRFGAVFHLYLWAARHGIPALTSAVPRRMEHSRSGYLYKVVPLEVAGASCFHASLFRI